jgi:hypothetical protein
VVAVWGKANGVGGVVIENWSGVWRWKVSFGESKNRGRRTGVGRGAKGLGKESGFVTERIDIES